VNPVTGKPIGGDQKLQGSASAMRDKAEAAAKAGKYGDAMEAYFAAEKLFRQAKSDAAADSMAAAAKAMAVKAKAAQSKGKDPYAKPALDIAALKKFAASGIGGDVKTPAGYNPVTGKKT